MIENDDTPLAIWSLSFIRNKCHRSLLSAFELLRREAFSTIYFIRPSLCMYVRCDLALVSAILTSKVTFVDNMGRMLKQEVTDGRKGINSPWLT